jgi:D-proline reductase (dithiol) PrdA
MSMLLEQALEHVNAPAVTCCRFEAGTVIGPEQLQDPTLLPDFERVGFLHIPANCLTIGQVLGATLTETVEGFTPLTPEHVVGVQATRPAAVETATPATPSHRLVTPARHRDQAGLVKRLVRQHITIDQVILGPATTIAGRTLSIRDSLCQEALQTEALVTAMTLDVIAPERYREYSDTILDVQPIAVKIQGEIGEGITRVLDGVVVVITGTDASGVQLGEFGASAGPMEHTIMWGRPGAPDHGDILLKTHITLQAGTHMQRPGPLAAHKVTEVLVQEIRDALQRVEAQSVVYTEALLHVRHPGQKRVVIVKEIMGQGAMHDNLLMPHAPVGISGAQACFDLGNVPIVVSPLHVLDGCIHALTCVGPASKETSRHYWREPLVLAMLQDAEVDCCAVVLVGSPQAYAEKVYVSQLLGTLIAALEADGVIVTTEGFGNNHVDFASHLEQFGQRGIPVVGMTYAAVQGQLVVGNASMDALVDLNKSLQGLENEVLAYNTLCPEDAMRALAMLKAKMAGEVIRPAPRTWDPAVKAQNIQRIEHTTGRKIALEEMALTVIAGLQSEIFVPETPPAVWTPVTKPLETMRIALVTAGGVHLRSQERFVVSGDSSYRAIPGDVKSAQLMVTHGGYDNSDANSDINCMFPLDRLRELAAAGVIKEVAPTHVGLMGGGGDVHVLAEVTGPAIAQLLRAERVDGVIMTAG